MGLQPRLPYDVLLFIASHAPRATLLSLMLTCRDLNGGCAKFMLKDLVKLSDNHDLLSFILFMRTGKRKRWRYLRSLRFGAEAVAPGTLAAEFVRVIPRASYLERLEFEHAETTLGAHPDLVPAFAALKTIKHIVIEGGYQHTCRMLEAMHWPLESATLVKTVYISGWFDATKYTRMHPASLLRNSRSTLKSLVRSSWIECSNVLPTYPVFPEVRSLVLEGDWTMSSAQLVVTYPNLRDLTVHTIEGQLMAVEADDLLEHAVRRRLSIEEHSAQDCWAQLESFSGGLLDLYLLGLPCRICNLSVDLSEDSARFFGPPIRDARPIRLDLAVTPEVFHSGLVDIGSCLRDPGLVDMKHLSISLDVSSPQPDVRMEQSLDHILNALQGLNAREFTFKLRCCKIPHPDEPDVSPSPPNYSCLVEAWATDVDLSALSQHILEQVPSLENVTLSIQALCGFKTFKETRLRREKTTDGVSFHRVPVDS